MYYAVVWCLLDATTCIIKMQIFGGFYCLSHAVLLSDKLTLKYKFSGSYEDVQT